MSKRKTVDASNISAPFSYRSPAPRVRTIRECFSGPASEAVGALTPGCEIFGFTKGQFSLIDLVTEVLEQTGPADVVIATWTAAHAEIKTAFDFLRHGHVRSLRWIVDRSFPSRQPEYCEALLRRFGPEVVRVTRTHAKFVLVQNETWQLAIRTSMNLNTNPRFEDYEISDDPALAAYLRGVADEIFTRDDCGEIMAKDTPAIDRGFREMTTVPDAAPDSPDAWREAAADLFDADSLRL